MPELDARYRGTPRVPVIRKPLVHELFDALPPCGEVKGQRFNQARFD